MGAMALLGTLALAGCAPQSAPPPPSATATTDAPVFATDAEALAAATETYAAYLAAGDASPADATARRDEFLSLSVGSAHEGDVSAAQLFETNGWHKTGTTTFDSIRLQSSIENGKDGWEIRTYLCLDVSESDVVDAGGGSVADPSRPLRLPLEVQFLVGRAGQKVLVAESQVWSGANFC
jgi:hypothetical protein